MRIRSSAERPKVLLALILSMIALEPARSVIKQQHVQQREHGHAQQARARRGHMHPRYSRARATAMRRLALCRAPMRVL